MIQCVLLHGSSTASKNLRLLAGGEILTEMFFVICTRDSGNVSWSWIRRIRVIFMRRVERAFLRWVTDGMTPGQRDALFPLHTLVIPKVNLHRICSLFR